MRQVIAVFLLTNDTGLPGDSILTQTTGFVCRNQHRYRGEDAVVVPVKTRLRGWPRQISSPLQDRSRIRIDHESCDSQDLLNDCIRIAGRGNPSAGANLGVTAVECRDAHATGMGGIPRTGFIAIGIAFQAVQQRVLSLELEFHPIQKVTPQRIFAHRFLNKRPELTLVFWPGRRRDHRPITRCRHRLKPSEQPFSTEEPGGHGNHFVQVVCVGERRTQPKSRPRSFNLDDGFYRIRKPVYSDEKRIIALPPLPGQCERPRTDDRPIR